MTEKTLKPISLIIPILVAMHWYLSFRWLFVYLKQVNLEMSEVITTNDVLFHFGDLNQSIVFMALSGFIMVIIARFAVSEKTFNKLNKKTIQGFKRTIKNDIDLFTAIKKRRTKIIILIILYAALFVLIFLLTREILTIELEEVSPWAFIFLILFYIAPIAYIFWVPKRNLIVFVSLLLLLKFANLLIDESVNSAINKEPSKFVEMSFIYNGDQKIQTDRDGVWSFYEGYRYIILRNPKNNEIFKYEPELITNLKRKVIDFEIKKPNLKNTVMIPPLNGFGKTTKTPITYYGGKQVLTKLILSLIPKHNLYCEPFVGGGAVFFAKEPSAAEVINDLNGNVVNFYQVCKQEFSKLNSLIQATPHSRKLHKEAAAILKNGNEKDKIKKAWAFWVQTNMSFSARIFGGYAYEKKTNGVSKTIFNKKQSFTKEICDRLDLVDIECNDALTVIKSRDTKDTFFYVDPPYFNSDMGHYKGYTEKDFIDLLELLSKIKGKFLLSSYPSKVLDAYKKKYKWDQHIIEKKVAVTKQTDKKKTEVLTANYDIQKKISNLSGVSELERMMVRSRALKLRLQN